MTNRKGRNRTVSIIPVVIIIVVIVGGLFVLSGSNVLNTSWTESTEAGTAVTGTVTGYNDGIPVSTIAMGSYLSGGLELTDLEVKVVWFSSGVSIDWSTFSLSGDTRVEYEFADGSSAGYIAGLNYIY